METEKIWRKKKLKNLKSLKNMRRKKWEKMKHEILFYNHPRRKVPEKFILDVILRTFDFLKLKQPAELAVLIVSADEIRKLNKIWRKKNYTPDELSFGLNSRKQAGRAKFAKKQNKMLEIRNFFKTCLETI